MIVTVTPNPSIDRTLGIPPLRRGAVQRARSATAETGGKGINVARALATQGFAALAVAPLSDASAAVVTALLAGAARLEPVPIDGAIRTNVGLIEDDGTTTKINEPGPTVSPTEVEALLARVVALADGADWVAGCGSLPPGAPADLYARLAARIGARARVAVDTEGPALRACAGVPIALLKPNRHELEQLAGEPLPSLGAVVGCAADIVARGTGAVLVSLGADGAVLVDGGGAIHAEARIDDVANTVGAGDALLAGFLAGGGRGEGLAEAVAWSVAACRSPGTRMRPVTQADRAAVVVHRGIVAGRRLVD
ncbi:MAG: 1-phosphofructokinase family hexose kinase [Chloroflexota bacterium]